jgi:hypothetical protein
MLLFVSYELRPSTDIDEFRRWSRETDIPATRALPGVRYFAGAKDLQSERRFIEFIQVDDSVAHDADSWNDHVSKTMPLSGQEQFGKYVDVSTVAIVKYDETEAFTG